MITDQLLILRSMSAVSATTSTVPIFDFNAISNGAYKVVVRTLDYTAYAAGTALWTLTVEVSDQLASGYVALVTIPTAGVALRREHLIDRAEIEQVKPGARYIRVTATKTGAPGDLSFEALLALP